MTFDWFTFVAQIINFLVLVLLLKHFLYERIVNVMSQRDSLITTRLDQARTKEQEAKQFQTAYRQELDQLKAQREAMLVTARQEVETQRQELLTMARSEVEQLKAGWRAAVEREQEAFLKEIRQRVGHQTCAIARQALRELANADLEQQAIDRFLAPET